MIWNLEERKSNKSLQSILQGLVLFAMMFSLAAVAEADELSSRLESHFNADSSYRFINYESVNQVHADEYGSMRYLVMDFDLRLASNDLQGSIHQICNTVLADRQLIKDLSRHGYDMVSVSFDRQSQYDCL
ncbi:hypothetical protein A3740_13735 [Oleiphilus sp. HI0068]|jgi:hypothetical protein|uniref:hypothetical protein n=1 Tax=unclassified Oleiphilus TaxID=2631174 RepID=UPI0007C3B37F|nr:MULTISPECIES: hypothetical protein [unclassified Oleiphilus]KZY73717.1 hypothetical protein A3740_18390 [Oleiphilus sp. HI0068]KZY77806.1 hypothetical protein A3741_09005 [Oleiphilus sp. HI0069]KZZ33737.1 hypothetical protein A3755_07155 [Oleiphilus sp. HI0085]KZY60391.1 hypothetical protein A3735_01860 [Oleiphilus sp. HI0061]KZY76096.1 hypothetical protein A3740_13735 [Oleiphilus sp. HI0068]